MAENADTSASAASNGDGSSPLAASAGSARDNGAPRPAWQGRVDFYILEGASSSARLKLACKLAEKAYLASQSVLVWHTDPAELRSLDDMLWTFSDSSFVPHDVLPSSGARGDIPVLLSPGVMPSANANTDIIINLAAELPACLSQTRRVVEIIDGDDARRRAGRARFKAYRELGVQPASHNIRGDWRPD
ncbi:MAG: DNA polymerase III subunit chi [Steroidobacteraceae bacterium]